YFVQQIRRALETDRHRDRRWPSVVGVDRCGGLDGCGAVVTQRPVVHSAVTAGAPRSTISAKPLPRYRRMVKRLHGIPRWIEHMKAVGAVAVGEGAVQHGDALGLQVFIPGVEFFKAVDDEAVVIHRLDAAAFVRSAT